MPDTNRPDPLREELADLLCRIHGNYGDPDEMECCRDDADHLVEYLEMHPAAPYIAARLAESRALLEELREGVAELGRQLDRSAALLDTLAAPSS